MDIHLDTSTLRFFESEDRAFTAGNRSFHIRDSGLKGEHALVAPYGAKTFSDKTILPVLATDALKKAIEQFEQEIQEKIVKEIPDFIEGTSGFFSCLKVNNQGETMINLKMTPETVIEMYDVKKGTFSKQKMDAIPNGSKVSVAITLRHPWKYEIKGKQKYGVSMVVSEVVVYNQGDLKKRVAAESKSIKDFMVESTKKRIKMVDHKDL